VVFTKALVIHLYTIFEFTPSTILLYPPNSTGIFFPFTDICTQYLHDINPIAVFPHLLLPPTGAKSPLQRGPILPSYSLIFINETKKKMTFSFL
jgi:hypothetical protein